MEKEYGLLVVGLDILDFLVVYSLSFGLWKKLFKVVKSLNVDKNKNNT